MKLNDAMLAELERSALALPGATLSVQWGGVRVLKVAGKMFVCIHDDGIAYKVADEDFLALSGLPGVMPAPYLARARWIRVNGTEALDTAAIAAGLAASWRLVLAKLPKKIRAVYGL